MNDHSEVKDGWRFIRKYLSSIPKDETVQTLIDFASQPFTNSAKCVYIASATLKRDDANHWRLYSDYGQGYVIEIEPQTPLAVITEKPAEAFITINGPSTTINFADVFDLTRWYGVIYKKGEKTKVLDSFVNRVREALSSPPAFNDPEDQSEWYADQLGHIRVSLATIACLFKPKGFAGEAEVRAVALFWGGGVTPHAKFKTGPTGLTPYVRLGTADSLNGNLEKMFRLNGDGMMPLPLPILSVGIGPLLPKPGQKQTLECILADAGNPNARVWKSKVPLR